jgi:hypothetical protein
MSQCSSANEGDRERKNYTSSAATHSAEKRKRAEEEEADDDKEEEGLTSSAAAAVNPPAAKRGKRKGPNHNAATQRRVGKRRYWQWDDRDFNDARTYVMTRAVVDHSSMCWIWEKKGQAARFRNVDYSPKLLAYLAWHSPIILTDGMKAISAPTCKPGCVNHAHQEIIHIHTPCKSTQPMSMFSPELPAASVLLAEHTPSQRWTKAYTLHEWSQMSKSALQAALQSSAPLFSP